VEQLTREAVALAADPTHNIELATVAALPAWETKRIAGWLPPGERGSLRIETEEFVAPLGGSPAHWSRRARGLLATEHTLPAPLDEFEILWQAEGLHVSAGDLLAGLHLPPDSDARRPT